MDLIHHFKIHQLVKVYYNLIYGIKYQNKILILITIIYNKKIKTYFDNMNMIGIH